MGKEKTHICSVCAKSFRKDGNLNIHERSHNSEKLFECPDCNELFDRETYNLKTHSLKTYSLKTTSEDGNVRTVQIGLRNRRERVTKKKAGSLPLTEFEVGVQWLVLIHAVEEQRQIQDQGDDQVQDQGKLADKICTERDQGDDQGPDRGDDQGPDQGDDQVQTPTPNQTPNYPPKIEDLVDAEPQVRCQAGAGTDPFASQGADKYVVEPVVSDTMFRSSGRLRGKCGVGASRFDGRNYTT